MFDFFILIQGPFIKSTGVLVKKLHQIEPNIEIVVSCYDEIIERDLRNFCKIVRSDDPGTISTPPRGKPFNLRRQATTTLSGCMDTRAKWVLKLRSDLDENSRRNQLQRKAEEAVAMATTLEQVPIPIYIA